MANLSESDAAIQACEYLEAYKPVARSDAEITSIRNLRGRWKVTFETPIGEVDVVFDENTRELDKYRCENLLP